MESYACPFCDWYTSRPRPGGGRATYDLATLARELQSHLTAVHSAPEGPR